MLQALRFVEYERLATAAGGTVGESVDGWVSVDVEDGLVVLERINQTRPPPAATIPVTPAMLVNSARRERRLANFALSGKPN